MSDELKDLLERCIWTFVEAATSALVITPALGIDISNLENKVLFITLSRPGLVLLWAIRDIASAP